MLVSTAWILPAASAVISRVAQAYLQGWKVRGAGDLLFAGGDWLLYAFLTPGVFAVSKRWPLTRPHLARRVMLHLGFSLLFCVVWATLGNVFQFGLDSLFDPHSTDGAMQAGAAQFWRNAGLDWLSWIFTTLPFGIAVYLCVVGTEHAIRYFIETRKQEVRVVRLSEQLAGARLAALQAQVNPHFLFNTLNTIAVLVREDDRQGAVNIVEQLSEVLRTTLSTHHANEVTLGEELELVRRYVAIEQARFSDRLRPEFRIDETLLSAAMPSFALQHLAENAIRHGIVREPEAGRLIIMACRAGEMLEVSVADDGVGIDPETDRSKGHGIENTRERLRALYGNRSSLVIERRPEGGTIAELKVPYREMIPESNHGTR